MKIKICGLFRREDILYANEAQPDYIGFVFAPSRRQVSRQQAKELRSLLIPGIQVVGVYVNAPAEEIIDCLRDGIIDVAQLHGEETEETIRYIQKAAGKPVIKAVKVRSRSDVEAWLDSAADYLLFDNGQGTGQRFDWEMLKGIGREYFLAGGLGEDNLEEACRRTAPFCLDVSSGAETGGVKDREKMERLVAMVRKM